MSDEAPAPGRRQAMGTLAVAAALLIFGVVLLVARIDWPSVGRWGRPRAPWIVTFTASGILAGIGSWNWFRKPKRRRRGRTPGLSWWVVALAALFVVVVAWGATSWLLGEADSAHDRGGARVDAIKTGLGIGAGTTGIFALLLAVRRQSHQEHAAADTVLDATERRVTELYTKAVEQLGSAKAPVRLGGLYALERLGETHETQRHTIINVLCAYLRMRYVLPAEPVDEAPPEQHDRYEDRLQEAQVRFTAQRIVRRHRQRHRRPDPYWPDVTVDLRDANLRGADLTNADLSNARVSTGTVIDVSPLYDVKDGMLVVRSEPMRPVRDA